jgi:hypothetical protein
MKNIFIYITFFFCLILINNVMSISIEINENSKSSSLKNQISDLFDQKDLIRTRKDIFYKSKKNPRKNINIISAYLRFASKDTKFLKKFFI